VFARAEIETTTTLTRPTGCRGLARSSPAGVWSGCWPGRFPARRRCYDDGDIRRRLRRG